MDHIFKLIEQKVLQDKLNITEMILRYIVLVVTIVAASENMCTVLKKGLHNNRSETLQCSSHP